VAQIGLHGVITSRKYGAIGSSTMGTRIALRFLLPLGGAQLTGASLPRRVRFPKTGKVSD
jgi:hypothetical protein